MRGIHFKMKLFNSRFSSQIKYFNKILFLITNLIYYFNEAILNRVYLIINYKKLDKNIRKIIITHFLKRINNN